MKHLFRSASALLMSLILFAGLTVPAVAEGMAPVAENLELCTYRNVTVSGALSAYDPDGDIECYEITTDPVKGCIELSRDGSFTYTPGADKKGKDYFGYRAVDKQGNCSQEATVIIKIQKQRKNVAYSDLEGLAGEYFAIALSESGVFTGEQICGEYCFYPDKPVTRGEFISMCMRLSDEPVFSGVLSTGYGDDESIPTWMKGYAMTAAMCGVDDGLYLGEQHVFNAGSAISRSEAAVILNRALGLNDVSYMELDASLEREAAQACANLCASGISDGSVSVRDGLTRLEAAELLAKALELIKGK